jgi:hypothetical protein
LYLGEDTNVNELAKYIMNNMGDLLEVNGTPMAPFCFYLHCFAQANMNFSLNTLSIQLRFF